MRVLVIGGGIIGLASSYFLSRRDVDVTVLEKSTVGAGSTGFGGGIRTQFSTPSNVRLTLESQRTWETFESTFGVDINPRQIGYLLLARECSTLKSLREDVAMQRDLGVPNRIIGTEEAAEQCPGLQTNLYCGAAYSPTDSFVDANLALQGFASESRINGVEIRTNVEVTDLLTTADAVHGVETATGDKLRADFVVNAAGAWGGTIAAMTGFGLPIRSILRRQLLVTPATPFPKPVPLTMDKDTGTVFYPEDEDSFIISGQIGEQIEVDPDHFQTNIDIDWMTTVLKGVKELSTHFGGDTRQRAKIAGLYAQTPDRNPIIEKTCPGFVNVVGFSGHGFMHAPAAGRLVTELIVDGEASLLDISRFASDRFTAGSTAEQSVI